MLALDSEFTPMMRRLACLRGISTLTAFGLAVEIGDWDRFTGASIGAYLGLVPSEHSSGSSRSQGSITKTGNGHARRLLVEAAWHHRKPFRPTAVLRRRWEQAPPAAQARDHAGNRRLYAIWASHAERKKPPVVTNVVIARELAGWCWSLALLPDWPSGHPVSKQPPRSTSPSVLARPVSGLTRPLRPRPAAAAMGDAMAQ